MEFSLWWLLGLVQTSSDYKDPYLMVDNASVVTKMVESKFKATCKLV